MGIYFFLGEESQTNKPKMYPLEKKNTKKKETQKRGGRERVCVFRFFTSFSTNPTFGVGEEGKSVTRASSFLEKKKK